MDVLVKASQLGSHAHEAPTCAALTSCCAGLGSALYTASGAWEMLLPAALTASAELAAALRILAAASCSDSSALPA